MWLQEIPRCRDGRGRKSESQYQSHLHRGGCINERGCIPGTGVTYKENEAATRQTADVSSSGEEGKKSVLGHRLHWSPRKDLPVLIQFIFYLRKLVQKDCSSLCKALWDRDAAVSKEEIRCCFPPLRHQSAERERDEWASEGRRRGAITGLTEGAESRNNNHTSSPKRNRGGYSEAACHTKKANKASNHPAAADHTQMSL